MKFLAGITVLTAALTVGITAFADSTATYTDTTNNTVSVTDTGSYQTVMITKADDPTNVVYLNQTDNNSFGATADFMLKDDTDYGKYTVQLGNESGATSSVYFYIGMDNPNGEDIAMTRVGEEASKGKYNVGYMAELTTDQYNGVSAIKVVYSDSGTTKTGGYRLDDMFDNTYVSGGGGINLLFQINGVATAYKDSITVFLSNDELTDTKLSAQQGGEQ